ncbi:MAG: maleylacetate reductase [Chloroflexota bacterium]
MFTFTSSPQRIVFGRGEVGRMAAHRAAVEGRRPLLCTSGSSMRNGAAARVGEAVGAVAVFSAVRAHVPEETVEAALDAAVPVQVDMVVALGGGSALGTAKAVVVALSERGASGGSIPLVAIPTTYAGSEMTPVYGVTRAADGRKVTTRDARALPSLVVYDPDLTLDLPVDLTASTGVNALAHCIEGLYSTTRNPVSTATAIAALAMIHPSLPRCVADGHDRDARGMMLTGAYLAGTTIAHAGMALHHGICHVLGGVAGVPHGVANAVVLPHAMRFNLSTCAPQLASAAPALGIEVAGMGTRGTAERVIEETARFIGALGLPRRLRDAGVRRDALSDLAAHAMTSTAVQANPRPIRDASEIERLLADAW